MANLDSIARLADTDGILAVDKPAGLAAHDVVKAVKSRFNLVKAGHGGTLETNASGLFLVLLGDATRLSASLMADDRAWTAEIRLGRSTDTHDADGRLLAERPWDGVTREAFDAALKDFKGDIYLAPPEFSAVRLPGSSGYDVVRTAEGDELRERMVHVYRIAVAEFAPPSVTLEISATRHANVRSLAAAIGESLGCGACVERLRRTACGKWRVDGAIPFMDALKLDAVALRERVVPMARRFSLR